MNGSGLIIVELAVRCSKAAAVLDNTLRIKLAVQEWAPCGFTLVYNRRTHFDGGLTLAEQRLVDHAAKTLVDRKPLHPAGRANEESSVAFFPAVPGPIDVDHGIPVSQFYEKAQ